MPYFDCSNQPTLAVACPTFGAGGTAIAAGGGVSWARPTRTNPAKPKLTQRRKLHLDFKHSFVLWRIEWIQF